MFSAYITQWGLIPDGDPIVTRSSRLLPVRWQGLPAMLKVAIEAEEKFGGMLMIWWDWHGAARVLAHQGDAILLERAEGKASLAHLARTGRDDDATRIICDVIARLHAPKTKPLPQLIPLSQWFDELWPAASTHGGMLSTSAAAARRLLSSAREARVLHGDVHHDNILDFGLRGWLAIDPKCLVGENGFDYANLFCNPDQETAIEPGCFARRVRVVSEAAALEPKRLLTWILAWAGLSAAWSLADGARSDTPLKVAELAAAELSQ